MLPPLVLNLVLSLHPNSWAARTPGGGDGGKGVVEGCRAFWYPGPWMHMPACFTHTKHTHAGCHPH